MTNLDKLKVLQEINKCKESPYYFATTYMQISTPNGKVPFTTNYTEAEFNLLFKSSTI